MMITLWMVQATLVALCWLGAAFLLDGSATALGARSRRWIWAGAMGGAVLLAFLPPIVSLPTAGAGTREAMPGGVGEAVVLAVGTTGAAATGAFFGVGSDVLERLDLLALLIWGGLVLILISRLVSGVLSLRRQLREWPEAHLPEGPVLVSEEVGPALVGLFRTRVVLPRWCLSLSPPDRSLILAHESEHARAGDTLLVSLSGILVLALPWNLPLWTLHRRLREAVELDCDERVTRSFPGERRRYGELLLRVGSRQLTPGTLGLAGFSTPTSPLERRIQMLTRYTSGTSARKGLFLAATAILLIVGACLIPGPDRSDGPTDPVLAPPESVEAGRQEARRSSEPVFTPYSVAPEVRNRVEIGRALEAEYPPLLREAGVGGTALVHVFIDEEGGVETVRLAEGSGREALDQAALRVAERFQFTPALNRDEPVPVWIQIPITFMNRGGAEGSGDAAAQRRERVEEAVAADRAGRDALQGETSLRDEPDFTPFTVAPEVRNRVAVGRALETEYPPLLREAGIEGTVLLHFFLEATGELGNVLIAESSGHQALDEAALRVAEHFQFTPALNRDDPVPVWIQIPITFRP